MSVTARPLLLWSLLLVAPIWSNAAQSPLPTVEAKMQTLPNEQILDGVVEAV
ncbi:MAG: hypothetical protein JNJ76_11565, partial [Candidatus Competibacter sp.]|nr:hypothetical protein [Candidatus Competibacter sp.]